MTWYGRSAFMHDHAPRIMFGGLMRQNRELDGWLHTMWGGVAEGKQDRWIKDPEWGRVWRS